MAGSQLAKFAKVDQELEAAKELRKLGLFGHSQEVTAIDALKAELGRTHSLVASWCSIVQHLRQAVVLINLRNKCPTKGVPDRDD